MFFVLHYHRFFNSSRAQKNVLLLRPSLQYPVVKYLPNPEHAERSFSDIRTWPITERTLCNLTQFNVTLNRLIRTCAFRI